MHHRMKAAAWGALLFVSLSVGIARPALAEPTASDKTAAETLFVDARKLLAAGKYLEACKALAESQRLDPGVGTLLNLGRCYEKLGRTASAWSTYREAAAAARAANQGAREKNARHAADALEAKLAKMTIVVTNAETNPRVEVHRDGAIVPASLWGMSVAVDPGEHVFEAMAPGMKTWRSQIVAEAGKQINVVIPVLEPDPKAAATARAEAAAKKPKAETESTPVHRTPEPTPPPSSGIGGQRVAAIVVGSAGLVGAAVAGFFTLRAKSAYNGAECDKITNICSDQGKFDRDVAFVRARNATIAGIGAGVAVAAGIVLWVTAPSAPSTDAATRAPNRLWVSADPIGENGTRSVTIGGVF